MECLSLKGGCTGSSESIHVKISHCWKSRAAAQLFLNQKYIFNVGEAQENVAFKDIPHPIKGIQQRNVRTIDGGM